MSSTKLAAAALLLLASIVATSGCPSDDCKSDSDCFARETCLRGECVPEADDTGSGDTTDEAGSCEAGLTRCDGECVDTDNDEDHCGTCGNTCSGGTPCVGGVCAG